jgi:hypothetical protein
MNYLVRGGGPDRPIFYLFLLAVQLLGAVLFIWEELPEFRQVLLNPGEQLPKDAAADLLMVGIVCVMQVAFWIRIFRVQIPVRRSNIFFSHLFLFLGRLSFIFGSALFSVTVFRHLPELGPQTSRILLTQRSIIVLACLFALFCTSLEVERLGQAFDGRAQ